MNDNDDRTGAAARFTRWLLLALIPIAFFMPVPHYGRTFDRILDAGHLFVFTLIGLLVMRRLDMLPIATRSFCTLIICGLIGLAIELCQPIFSRRTSLSDWWIDLCGATIGIGFAVAITRTTPAVRRRIAFAAAVALVSCTICIVMGVFSSVP